MNTLICAGGSGSRVLESVIHLCAAGLGPKELRVLVIDPDATNGSLRRSNELLQDYRQLHSIFGQSQSGGANHFFSTKIDVLSPDGKLQNWSPVVQGQLFKDLLNYNLLKDEQKEVVRLLFTEEELTMPLDIGFRGHPALGAAALSLLPLYKRDNFWSRFNDALENDLTTDPNVVIVGSIFGGTGASAIHPLVRYLRLKSKDDKRLKVGAVAMVPYFQFTPEQVSDEASKKAIENAAQSALFPLASRSAAQYYEHLQATNDWEFDAMYWVGNDTAKDVSFAMGGDKQENPAHYVDMLAAMACFDFFTHSRNEQVKPKQCWYCGPDVASKDGPNVLKWSDLPFQRNSTGATLPMLGVSSDEFLVRWLTYQMCAVADLGFNEALLRDPRLTEKPYFVPWYAHLFDSPEGSLNGGKNAQDLQALRSFWQQRYFSWCTQMQIGDPNVQLLNPHVWNTGTGVPDVTRLANLRQPNSASVELDTLDRLFTLMVSDAEQRQNLTSKNGTAVVYLELLARAARKLVIESEQKVPA